MAMTKAEMERHQAEYQSLVSKARSAHHQGQYAEALGCAVASWDHIDGMMQYERRFGNGSIARIECLDLVLTLAPFLFDFQSLDKLVSLLKSQRRIERNTTIDWSDGIAKARLLMRDARALWDRLEARGSSGLRLRDLSEIDAAHLQSIVQAWEHVGLIRRNTNEGTVRLELTTQLDAATRAKCPSCGALAKAPKVKLLDEVACPRCREIVSFVLLVAEPAEN